MESGEYGSESDSESSSDGSNDGTVKLKLTEKRKQLRGRNLMHTVDGNWGKHQIVFQKLRLEIKV